MKRGVFAVAAAVLLCAGTALGVATPAQKCESSKNMAAGKYAQCRQSAEAKRAKSVGSCSVTTATSCHEDADCPVTETCSTKYDEAIAKCETKYQAAWQKAEQKASDAAATCPDASLVVGQFQAAIDDHTDLIATALSGAGLPTCGDNAINVAGEQCDGTNLGGETCVSLGLPGGALACSACQFDTSGCTGTCSAFPASGQTTAYGPGSDGDVEAGATLSYTDNGDGTITDNNTGLMWEKKDDSGGIHDRDNQYTWGMSSPPYTMNGTMVTTFLAALNSGGGFAGHTDWRIPNYKELVSILNLENVDPAVSPAFNTACAPGCTVTSCSCMGFDYYWSSTTYQDGPGFAWHVDFYGGYVDNMYPKAGSYLNVRAVRGGL